MYIYRDLITGDELFTDTYKITKKDGIWEVEGKIIDVGADNIDDSLIGGNASAEEASEALDAGTTERKCNIVHDNRLVEQPKFPNGKAYKAYLKEYMAAVLAKMKEAGRSTEDIDLFKSQMNAAIKPILANIKNYDVFVGESMNPSGMSILLDFREDGITPYMIFFKEGLVEEKA